MDKTRVLKRIGIGIAAATMLYTLAGFLIIPMTAEWFINSRMEEKIGRPVHVSKVHFNPWTLAAGIDGLTVDSNPRSPEHGGTKNKEALFSVNTIRGNLAVSSLVTMEPVITQVLVDSPRFQLERHPDNTFNISDIIQRFSNTTPTDSPSAESNEGIPFRVSNVKLIDGHIFFKDHLTDQDHRIDGISLDLPMISSLEKEQYLPVNARLGFTFNGGNISLLLKGVPFSDTPSGQLELNISDFGLEHYLSYLPIPAGFAITSPGKLETRLAIDYAHRESNMPRIGIFGVATLKALSVGMQPQGEEQVLPLIVIPELSVEPAVDDLFSGGIKLGNITVDDPEFHLERNSNGALLPMTLLANKEGSTDTPDTNSPRKEISPIPIEIAQAEIKNASFNFVDNAVTPSFAAKVKNTGLVVRDLKAGDNLTFSYALNAFGEAVEKISLEGNANVGMSDVSLSGNVGIEGIRPEKIKAYYAPFIGDALGIGAVDLGSNFRFSLKGGTKAGGLTNGKLMISDIRLADQNNDTPSVQLGSLGLSDIRLNLEEEQLMVGSVSTDHGRIQAIRDRLGNFNILQTIQSLPVMNKKDEGNISSDSDEKKPPAWDIKIGGIAVDDYTIGFADELHKEPIDMKVSDIRIRAAPFGTQSNPKGDFSAEMNLKSGGKLVVDGTMDIPGSKANMEILVNKINLTTFQPYFTDYLNISIGDGDLQAKGRVSLGWADTKHPTVSYQGEAGINDFISKNKATGNEFFKFKSFYLGGMEVSVFPVKVRIKEVSLSDFYKRAVLSKDGRLNLTDIVVKMEDGQDAANTKKKKAQTPLPEVTIDTITIQGGHVNFTDYLTTPNYTANMTDIGGSVTGLSSRGNQPASVRLKGLHGTHSPLDISGTIDPLKQVPAVDLGVSFKNIELPQFNAYARKYLGYEIEKGKLILDLKYKIKGTSLDSTNRIFFDQFTLGERVDSKDATSLPVELAVSLLKNSRGEIDLDVPVKGDLSDPEFSYGSVVFKTVSNLMLSIVKAPFKILGSLMGFGGEELGSVAFGPGSYSLTDDARENLDQLAALLGEKPQISLEILGRFDANLDEAQIRQQRFKALLTDHSSKMGLPETSNPDTISSEQRDAVVAAAYTAAEFPKPKDASGKEMDISTNEKEKLLITGIAIQESDLHGLALERSDTIRDYLVGTGKVDPGRIFISKPGPAAETDTETRLVRTLFKLK